MLFSESVFCFIIHYELYPKDQKAKLCLDDLLSGS